jgi:hypothetical protein
MKKFKFVSNLLLLLSVSVSFLLVGCSGGPKKKKTYTREPDVRPKYAPEEFASMKKAKLGPVKERIGLIIAPGQYQNKTYTTSGYILESFEMVLSAMDDQFDYVYSTPTTLATGTDNQKKLKRCIKSCGKNTFLVVFLAGKVVSHNNKFYLLNYDTNPLKIPDTAIDLKLFFKQLDDSGCGRVLVFADLYLQDKTPGKLMKYLIDLPAFKKKYDLTREMRLLVTNHSVNGKPFRFYVGFQGADIFGWYVALGLRGQADRVVNGGNNDDKTTSGELVRYIREEVSGAMIYKQRPAVIGNFLPKTVVLK